MVSELDAERTGGVPESRFLKIDTNGISLLGVHLVSPRKLYKEAISEAFAAPLIKKAASRIVVFPVPFKPVKTLIEDKPEMVRS
jgi:hypothetical protein